MTARRIFPRLILLLVVVGAGFWLTGWWGGFTRTERTLPPSGGLYFPVEVVIDVPYFAQGDPRWGQNRLGPTDATLAAEGCALASAAMVLASYGAATDPGQLNDFVSDINGYTLNGWLYWEAAAEVAPGLARLAYEDDASYRLIDGNLLAGNPVIVRVRFPGGMTHFVVIVGKRGFDYLIRDPGTSGSRGMYPLAELGLPIEALRFYQPLAPPGAKSAATSGDPPDPLAAFLATPARKFILAGEKH